MMERLRAVKINLRELLIGTLLMGLSLLLPMVVHVDNFGIYPMLFSAISHQEKTDVVYAALRLVALNSIRSLPHYLGAYLIGESMDFAYREKTIRWLRLLIVCVMIPPVYFLIEKIYHIRYDFGGPAILLIALLVILEKIDFSLINISKKMLMLVMLIASVQFLDVMPALEGLPVGGGEVSTDIRRIAFFLEADGFLQFEATLLFFLLFVGALLFCKLIMDENDLKLLSELKEQNERMRTEKYIQMLEERTLQELRNLVHDLKTPLTAAQALVGVVKMNQLRTDPPDAQSCEYLTRVEASMEHMSVMISEILYENRRASVTTQRLVTALLSQISNTPYGRVVRAENEVPELRVWINEVRMLRALANVLQNAYCAMDKEEQQIFLRVSAGQDRDGQRMIQFDVIDNGRGMDAELLHYVWADGFSTRGSSGLGLNFVQQVVQNNNGTVEIKSTPGEGTVVTIQLPESGVEG
ncbi:sensor histidine kinase [Anaerotruncus sp. X29]|nr:sensor histidine kinase [Anaerotruncus sp. X29]